MTNITGDTTNFIDTRPMRAGAIPRRAKVTAALRSIAALGYVPGIPAADRVLITDISHWNGTVDFVKMRAAGAVAFYQKATEGISNWKDQTLDARRAAANDIDYPFGLYHFLRPYSGLAQARLYLDKTGADRGALYHMVDVEVPLPGWIVREYVANIHAELGYYPIVYTSHYCWSQVTGAEDKAWVAARCDLNAAHWNGGNSAVLIPNDWPAARMEMHQFSANGNGRAAEFGCTGQDADIDLNWARRSWFGRLRSRWRRCSTTTSGSLASA